MFFAALVLLSAQDADTLRVSWGAPVHLDPHKAVSIAESRYVLALFEGLTTPAADGLTAAPGMAERWETSDDGLAWTFHLRAARWSNGDPVTAGDFVYAWRRALRTGSPFSGLFADILGVEPYLNALRLGDPQHEKLALGFEAADARTLRVRLERRAPWLPDLLSFMCFVPLHERTLAAHGEDWVKAGRIVTNGPYLFESASPVDLVLRRSPAYWDSAAAAAPAKVVCLLHSPEIAMKKFEAGAIDWLGSEQIPGGEPKGIVAFGTWGTAFLRLNAAKAPFDRAGTRQAFARSVDRAALAKVARGTPVERLVPAGFPGYPEARGLAYDRAAAVEGLLKETGFELSKFPRIDLVTDDAPRSVAAGRWLQEQWEATLAINVRLHSMKWPAYLEALAKGEYHAALSEWMGDFFDPASFLDIWAKDHPSNRTGWSSAEYDRLLGAAAKEADAAKRLAGLASAESLLLGEAAVVPLLGASDSYLATPKVAGLRPNPLSRFSLKHVRLRRDTK